MILLYHSLLEVLLTQTQTKIFGNFCFRFCYFLFMYRVLKYDLKWICWCTQTILTIMNVIVNHHHDTDQL